MQCPDKQKVNQKYHETSFLVHSKNGQSTGIIIWSNCWASRSSKTCKRPSFTSWLAEEPNPASDVGTIVNIWTFPKIGFSPQIIHGLIGSSIIFTIHFGVPLYLETLRFKYRIMSISPSLWCKQCSNMSTLSSTQAMKWSLCIYWAYLCWVLRNNCNWGYQARTWMSTYLVLTCTYYLHLLYLVSST